MSRPSGAANLRNHLEKVLEEWADTIKDAVLDWDPVNERANDALGYPLPLVPPAQLIEALQGELETLIQLITQVVNQSPTGTIDPAAARQVQAVFAGFVNRAIVRGLQMRLDAGEAAPGAPVAGPQSEWAKRYRSMMKTLPHPGLGAAASVD